MRYKAPVTNVIKHQLQASYINHQLQPLENTSLSKVIVPKEEEVSQKFMIFLNENADNPRTQAILKSMMLLRWAEFACRWDGRGEEHLQKCCVQTS
jgi:hypothetical protein